MTRLALILALLPLAAGAEEIDCNNATAQMELTWCAESDWNAADHRLNDAYKGAVAAMKRVDANLPAADQGAEAALRAGQRAWITYRDQNCAAEAWAFHGGTAEPMVIYSCRARLSVDRAKDLENMTEAD